VNIVTAKGNIGTTHSRAISFISFFYADLNKTITLEYSLMRITTENTK